jgi:hypothetical protein
LPVVLFIEPDQSSAPRHACAKCRLHRQPELGRRFRNIPCGRLLPHGQIRNRGPLRDLGEGGRSTWDRCYGSGASSIPDRVSKFFLAETVKESDRCVFKDTAGSARDKTVAGHGDPERGARAIIAALESDHPPLHLVLGGEAPDQFRQKVRELQREWTTGSKSRGVPVTNNDT